MQKSEHLFTGKIELQPLSEANWNLFEDLMGEKGGCGGCWCMLFRLTSKAFRTQKFEGNKRLMQKIAADRKPSGLIAINDKKAIGWIALAPREDYLKIEQSRSLKRIDDKEVWSITCFFIRKDFRKKGISQLLIKGAIAYAKRHDVKTLEAYPVIPYSDKTPDVFLWVGIVSAFTDNGFHIVRQNGKSKVMVRLDL